MFEDFDVIGVLFCDDARREDNGKELLIGVYSETISLHAAPCSIAINVWLHTRTKTTNDGSLKFRLVNSEGVSFSEMEAEYSNGEPGGMSSVTFNVNPIYITGATDLSFQIAEKGKDNGWVTVGSIPVKILSKVGG